MTYIQLKRAMAQIELAAEERCAAPFNASMLLSLTKYPAPRSHDPIAHDAAIYNREHRARLARARALLVPQPGQTVEVKMRAHVEEVLLDEDTLGYVARVRVWGDGHWKGVLLDLPGDAVTNILP